MTTPIVQSSATGEVAIQGDRAPARCRCRAGGRPCSAHLASTRGLTRLAASLTGLPPAEARQAMKELRRANRHEPAAELAPTAAEWATMLHRHMLLTNDVGNYTLQDRVRDLLREAVSEIPDGRTFHAQLSLVTECTMRQRRNAVRAARLANPPEIGQVARMAEGCLVDGVMHLHAGVYVRVIGSDPGELRVEVLRGAPGAPRYEGDSDRLRRATTGGWYTVPAHAVARVEDGDPVAAWYAERPHHWEGGFYTSAQMADIENDQLGGVRRAPTLG